MTKHGLLLLLLVSITVTVLTGPVLAQGKPEQIDVLIGFHSKPGLADLEIVQAAGGKINHRYRIIPSVAATIPANSVVRLLDNPRVKIVELDRAVKAHDLSETWGVERIGCGSVHDGTFSTNANPVLGTGVKVAVLDTGIDYTHSQLSHAYKGGYNFVRDNNDPMDDNYHGTHVAGTIAAARDNYAVVGVSPNADLYGLKVLNRQGSGSFSDVIAAMDWCVANGIQVANLSLGAGGDPGTLVKAAFDNAHAAGIVIVASAGNSGAGADTVGWPAQYDSVIAVASTDQSDLRSSFSSTGPKVEIAAPGSSIVSTYPGERYAVLSGTSMACPHVAGVAALIISSGIADSNQNGRVNDEVRLLMQSTADDLGPPGRDNDFGFGLVDADEAVSIAYDPNGGGDTGGGDPPETFDAPSNLLGQVSGSTVSLSWEDNSSLEDGFEVEQGVQSKGIVDWTQVATIAANEGLTATVDLLNVPNGKYRYRVRAIKNDGTNTNWSNEIQLNVGKGGKR